MWSLLQDVVNSLYKCVMSRLMAQDQDQEVKDCAISCMAAAVSQLGDVITPQLPQILQVTLLVMQAAISHGLCSLDTHTCCFILWPCCVTSCLLCMSFLQQA